MWTIGNQTSASISVKDIPIPQDLLPYSSGQFEVTDVLTSKTLAENIASGALVVTNFGTFAPGGPWLPVTYPLHPLAQEIISGQSVPVTVGVFSQGKILLNVTALTGTLSIAWQEYDGTTYYPIGTEIAAISAVGVYAAPFSDYGIAGRMAWTLTGTATFSLALQMR